MRDLFAEWWQGGGREWSKDVVREESGPGQVEDAAAFGFGAGYAAGRESLVRTVIKAIAEHSGEWNEIGDGLREALEEAEALYAELQK